MGSNEQSGMDELAPGPYLGDAYAYDHMASGSPDDVEARIPGFYTDNELPEGVHPTAEALFPKRDKVDSVSEGLAALLERTSQDHEES